MKLPSVTVIVTSFNASSVLGRALTRLYRQTYPIREILIIDNHSTDGSGAVAKAFSRRHRKVPMRVIMRDQTYGLSDSYNLGARLSKTTHIVTMHADGILPTKYELAHIMQSFVDHPKAVAAGPQLVHRMKEWQQYPFWQKCLFATSVGRTISSGNGKFDGYHRGAFLQIGGYDTKHFRNTLGAEDADMYIRLRRLGEVVDSGARVIHAHPVEKQYTLWNWVARRKFLAMSYGRYLQLHVHDTTHPPYGLYLRSLFPLITLLGVVHPVFFVPILVYPFFYMPVMFRSSSTLRDPRIILLPFILMFLLFYETYFMLYSFWFLKERQV